MLKDRLSIKRNKKFCFQSQKTFTIIYALMSHISFSLLHVQLDVVLVLINSLSIGFVSIVLNVRCT